MQFTFLGLICLATIAYAAPRFDDTPSSAQFGLTSREPGPGDNPHCPCPAGNCVCLGEWGETPQQLCNSVCSDTSVVRTPPWCPSKADCVGFPPPTMSIKT